MPFWNARDACAGTALPGLDNELSLDVRTLLSTDLSLCPSINENAAPATRPSARLASAAASGACARGELGVPALERRLWSRAASEEAPAPRVPAAEVNNGLARKSVSSVVLRGCLRLPRFSFPWAARAARASTSSFLHAPRTSGICSAGHSSSARPRSTFFFSMSSNSGCRPS
jgi:hypothetical protein